MGIDPPFGLPAFSEQERLFAPGWIETLDAAVTWQGAFHPLHDGLVFRANTGPELGDRNFIPWSKVKWVRLDPVSRLTPSVTAAHTGTLARSIDEKVVYGALAGMGGTGSEMFGLVGSAARPGTEWLEIFRVAGVKMRVANVGSASAAGPLNLSSRADWDDGSERDAFSYSGSIHPRSLHLKLVDKLTNQGEEIRWGQLDGVGVRPGELDIAISVSEPQLFIVVHPETEEQHHEWLAIFAAHGIRVRS